MADENICKTCSRTPVQLIQCGVCGIEYKNKYLNRHLTTQKHKAARETSSVEDPKPCPDCGVGRKATEPSVNHCEPCGVDIKKKSWEAHLISKRHKANAGESSSEPFVGNCEPCSFSTDDPVVYRRHLAQLAHRSRVNPLKTYCEACGKHYASLPLHLKVAKHEPAAPLAEIPFPTE